MLTATLPDVSRTDASAIHAPLQWVGMQGIDLPIRLAAADGQGVHTARVDAQVDLPVPHIKGIHMSRLYRLVDALADAPAVAPAELTPVLQHMVDSHQDCHSTSARVQLGFDLLARRAALVTPELAGWKRYPVLLQASLVRGVWRVRAEVTITYSSTCPCSAALTRQLVEQGFLADFDGQPTLSREDVAAWLRQHATLATPHSQRSLATVGVEVDAQATQWGLLGLIDAVEAALATPVQTAVKRADEQAFAHLNGQNLMFVEDAARRIEHALAPGYLATQVKVQHMESLHPHDAVAWAGSLEQGGGW